MRIGIVADDLTGAADAVAPFAMRGLSAAVAATVPWRGSADRGLEALAINSQTRDGEPARPTMHASDVRKCVRRFLECRAELIYQKIDSTLRGHLRLELDAVRKELHGRMAVICPAFPANGRGVMQGQLYVHGQSQTSVREAFDYGADAQTIPLDAVREGVDSLAVRFASLDRAETEVVFCDALEQSDLEILAQAVLRSPGRYLPVGSGGLSRAIAAQMQGENSNVAALKEIQERFRTGRVLIAVGSQNPVSRRQAEILALRAGIQSVSNVEAGVEQLLAGQRVALVCPEEAKLGFRTEHLFSCAKANDQLPDFCMAATGGATAMELTVGFYDCKGLRILGESEPGIVFGQIYGCGTLRRPMNGVPMMLKAGGFGDDETLVRCVGLV